MNPDELRRTSCLFLQNVCKSYGRKVVLDNIDLAVAEGEIVTVVGPSGCGKTTLLRLVLGQEVPTSGTLLIDGQPCGFADRSRGIVYQKYSLFPHLNVLDNVLVGPRLSCCFFEWRRRRKEFQDEAMRYLARIGLKEHWRKHPHELSGGMRQRVAIAQSLIMKPKILLMDEPFGALDPGSRENMQVFLLELWEEFGMTIFFVTHDLEEAVFLGTRIVVLSQHYTDSRADGQDEEHGSRIVSDHALPKTAQSTLVKTAADFGGLIQRIRKEGFDPSYMLYTDSFNLTHPHSFQTLRDDAA
jgi:NitT/TauT family transport system ATP-binding protein